MKQVFVGSAFEAVLAAAVERPPSNEDSRRDRLLYSSVSGEASLPLRGARERAATFGLSVPGGPAMMPAISRQTRMAMESVMHKRPSFGVRRAILVSVLLVLGWASLPRAQDLRLLDPNGYVRDAAYARPLVPAADQKYLKIDGLKMKDT